MSFYSKFFEGFYHGKVLDFVKWFFCIYGDGYLVFVFILMVWHITLVDFWTLNQSYMAGRNPTQSWCMILFVRCWTWFASILFSIHIHKRYWSAVLLFFSCGIFVWFSYQGNTGIIDWVWKLLSSSIFLEELWRIAVNSPLDVR